MTREEISIRHAESLISQISGQYVWSVRAGEGRILRMEFGEPHLNVHDIKSGGPDQAPHRLRRIVEPSGRWSLFVEDGAWSIQQDSLTCERDDVKETDKACLAALSGQRVEEVHIIPDTMIVLIKFDLGAVLNIAFEIDFEDNSSWILFCADGWNVSHSSQYGFDVERR